MGLGWKEAQAEDVVAEVVKETGAGAGTSVILKAALKVLGAKK